MSNNLFRYTDFPDEPAEFASAEEECAALKSEMDEIFATLRASGFQGNTLTAIVDDLWKTATADREALIVTKRERDLAQGAMRAQDENQRTQLAALGLTERFPSLTHLADDMGEALLQAEKQIAEIKQLLDSHCVHFLETDQVERVKFALALLEERSNELHNLSMRGLIP